MAKAEVFVLSWEYKDKSSHGIEAIYEFEARAIEDFTLLEKYDGERNWFIDPYPIKG